MYQKDNLKSMFIIEDSNAVIIEVEGVLKERLLTCLSDKQYCSSLTPNHLMYSCSFFDSSKIASSAISTSNFEKCSTSVVVSKHVKQHCILLHYRKDIVIIKIK